MAGGGISRYAWVRGDRRSTVTHTLVWWRRLRPYHTHGRTEALVGSSGRAHTFHASSRQHSRSGDGRVLELSQSRLVFSIWHGSTRPCTRTTSASAPPIDSGPETEIGIVDSMSDESGGGRRSHPSRSQLRVPTSPLPTVTAHDEPMPITPSISPHLATRPHIHCSHSLPPHPTRDTFNDTMPPINV